MKAKLYYVRSTPNSISLRWEVEDGTDDILYRVDLKDNTYKWITKYWGKGTECEIKGLGPETLYYFRLGASTRLGDEQVFSDILTTATKEAPPMLFYLFKSAERCDIKGLEAFLNERKDSSAIGAFDRKGETALIRAVSTGNTAVIRRLLLAGASVNQGGYGTARTPLMYACYQGHVDIARLLLQHGADINASDCNACGPLHYAVDWNHLELVRLCLEAGANINKKDSVGWSPIMRAVVLQCSEEIVKELISRKPDIQIKDRNMKTALDLAKLDSRNSIYGILKDYQAEEHEDKLLEIKEAENNNTEIGRTGNELKVSTGSEKISEGGHMNPQEGNYPPPQIEKIDGEA